MKILICCFVILNSLWFGLFQDKDLTSSIEKGKKIYQDFCITCHLANGDGFKGIFPPLNNADYLSKYRKESIYAVKYGQKSKIVVNGVEYNGAMPKPGLEDEEIKDVMNYVLFSWENKGHKKVTLEEVESVKK